MLEHSILRHLLDENIAALEDALAIYAENPDCSRDPEYIEAYGRWQRSRKALDVYMLGEVRSETN